MTFRLEKGIPVPPPSNGARGISKWPFKDMEVGDSFTSESVDAGHSAMRYAGNKYPDRKYVSRMVDHKTIRFWRIK